MDEQSVAVASNQVQLTRFGIGNFLGLIEAGKVKALAVSADKRSPLLPNVPTLAEAGLGGYPGAVRSPGLFLNGAGGVTAPPA